MRRFNTIILNLIGKALKLSILEFIIIVLFNNKQEITKCSVKYNNEYKSWTIWSNGSCHKEPKTESKYKPNNKKDSY